MRPTPDHGEDSYRGHGRLKDKVALITGADSGIGKAAAIAYAREGADVIVSYLSEDADAQDTARHVQDAGREALLVRGDIGDEAHCRDLIRQAVEKFGRIDVLVNNAAHQHMHGELEDVPLEDWRRTFQVNVDAPFVLTQTALPHMREGASIINTASEQAYFPTPSILAYATTKGALVTFTKGLAKMLAKRGIRANVVAPGPVWTPLVTQGQQKAEQVAHFGEGGTLGRPAQPAELAPVFVLLASDEGSYITGEVYGVTGAGLLP